MLARLLERAAPVAAPADVPPPVSLRFPPDAGYDALPRLAQLARDLAAVPPRARSRWKEAHLFFFDRRRQAELEAVRPAVASTDPFAELSTRIATELPALCASVDVRQAARGVEGLRSAAATLAPRCPAARDLAELLAVPDDEVVTVLHLKLRIGLRLVVRGIADIGQFHILLGNAADDVLPGSPVPSRFVAACREANPTIAAGVPMVAEARFQMYAPAALRTDGTLPEGFGGSDHWLWPHTLLSSVPRIDGERVVLLGPPAFRQTWEVTRRFPALPANVRLLEELNAFRVAERLGKLTGTPIAPAPRTEPLPTLAHAA
jgi:hypothetical protein